MSQYDDSLWTRIGNFLYNNRTWILGILVFIFFISTISLAARKQSGSGCKETPTPAPYLANCSLGSGLNDCFPENLPGTQKNESSCKRRGCCWDETTKKCRFSSNYIGYSVSLTGNNSQGLTARLKRNLDSGFKDEIQHVDLVITFLSDDMVRIKFTDPFADRWEPRLPEPLNIPQPEVSKNIKEVPHTRNPQYEIQLSQEGVLRVVRRSSRKVLLETNLSNLIFSDLFHQIEFKSVSKKAFGFSEHKENNFVKELNETRNYPVWNRGEQPSQGIRNLYGSHPFYLMPEGHEEGIEDSHGVFLFNSNAMDIVLHPTPSITWRVLGGVLDFFVFFGPSPIEVTKQYISLIGKPMIPPFWSLGFHIARYGYNNSEEFQKVIKRNQDINIPYDVQWTDIDALADYHNIFTYDKENFRDLPQIIQGLHEKGMKYIPMADPSVSDTDPNGKIQYDAGKEADVFVKREDGTTDLQVKVWNRNTSVWVDFTHPNASRYWHEQAVGLDKETPIDGLWIDMNEPYNMWDETETKCTNDIQPQYVPGIENGQLSNRTGCLNARHYLSTHYNVHNLYAVYEARVTYEALSEMQKRPFVLSRASTFSSGRYTAHWSGDIDSSWDHLRWTITSLLESNIYGISMIGADICGFQKYNVSEHLCARWMQLGAFYPFSRNHNDFRIAIPNTDTWISPKRDNDPGSWEPTDGKESVVVTGSRNALRLKYKLLPYFYTVMAENARTGAPAIRSLWFNNPTDVKAFDINDQFMWGDSVMVVPVVDEVGFNESKTERDYYLPSGSWWDIQSESIPEQGNGTRQNVTIEIEKILILIKSGSVVPTQDPKSTTVETRKGNFTLYIVLDEKNSATGSLYWDSGESVEPLANNEYSLIDFVVKDVSN